MAIAVKDTCLICIDQKKLAKVLRQIENEEQRNRAIYLNEAPYLKQMTLI